MEENMEKELVSNIQLNAVVSTVWGGWVHFGETINFPGPFKLNYYPNTTIYDMYIYIYLYTLQIKCTITRKRIYIYIDACYEYDYDYDVNYDCKTLILFLHGVYNWCKLWFFL